MTLDKPDISVTKVESYIARYVWLYGYGGHGGNGGHRGHGGHGGQGSHGGHGGHVTKQNKN